MIDHYLLIATADALRNAAHQKKQSLSEDIPNASASSTEVIREICCEVPAESTDLKNGCE